MSEFLQTSTLVLLVVFNVAAAYYAYRRTNDLLNPLVLILYISIFRYWLQALLYWSGFRSPHPYFALIPSHSWATAFMILAGGQAFLSAGFVAALRSNRVTQREQGGTLTFPRRLFLVSVVAMVVGIASLYYYFVLNVGSAFLEEFMEAGAFRGTFEGRKGTGKFLLAGGLSQYGAILLGAYALFLRRSRLAIALAAPTLAGIIYLVFGGRVNSLVALATVGLLAWRESRRHWNTWKILVFAAVSNCLLFLMAYFVVLLRGGVGLYHIAKELSFEGLGEYLKYALWNDIGHLYPVAMAVTMGPFSVDYSGLLNLVNPLGLLGLLGIKTSSVGQELAATFVDARAWGFHASFAGGMYLYAGVPGVVLGALAFGWILALAYRMGDSRHLRFRIIGALVLVRCILGVYISEPANFGSVLNDVLLTGMLLYLARF